jgi:hypothetical protein
MARDRDWTEEVELTKRMTAANATEWLEELAEQRPEQLDGWREQAIRACARALAANEGVRGGSGNVVPDGKG